jgi:hypothetical protein
VFALTDKQQEAIKLICTNGIKHTLLYGGAQSAKTYVALYLTLVRALLLPNSVHAVCRLRLVDLRSAIVLTKYPEILRHRYGDERANDTSLFKFIYGFPSYLELSNGAKIFFIGLEDNRGFEKILSPSYSTVVIDEASEVPYNAFAKLVTRLSQKNKLKKLSVCTLNPTSKRHWTYQLFFDKINPGDKKPIANAKTYARLQMNPCDNLDNLPNDYLQMLQGLPQQDQDRFLYGKYSDALDNAVFGQQIRDAEDAGRFVQQLTPDPELPYYAVFDLGINDATACWIVQFAKDRINLVAYNEWVSTSIIDVFKSWINCFDYKIAGIYLPHDCKHRWVGDGRTVEQMLQRYVSYLPDDKKFFIQVLKRIDHKWQQINMCRVFFSKLFFNVEGCQDGIEALREYKFETDESLGMFKAQPRHDWASHGADALMYVVQAWQYIAQIKEEPERDASKFYFDDIIRSRRY